jgi:hypothetical protein
MDRDELLRFLTDAAESCATIAAERPDLALPAERDTTRWTLADLDVYSGAHESWHAWYLAVHDRLAMFLAAAGERIDAIGCWEVPADLSDAIRLDDTVVIEQLIGALEDQRPDLFSFGEVTT